MAKREKHIYKRPNGKFEGRYIKGYDENGKAKYGSVYAATYAEVKVRLEQINKIEAPVSCHHKTLRDTLNAYLGSVKNTVKPATIGAYEMYISNYILPYFGNIKADALTNEAAQGFVNKLIENGLSARTVRPVFSFMKAALSRNFDVRLPKPNKKEADVFTPEEQKRLETAAKLAKSEDYIGVMICLYTGLRIGELCGLMWQDLDFEQRILHVRRTLQRIKNNDGDTKTKMALLPPKSHTSERTIPLQTFLIELLQQHKSVNGGIYVISKNNKPTEPRNFSWRFKQILNSANIRDTGVHTMRHAFATRALENGFDVKTLSEILGHSSPGFTLTQYGHSLDDHKRNSMEALSAIRE